MIKYFIALMLICQSALATDVVLGKYSSITWTGSGTNFYARWSSPATPWALPEYASTVLYYKFDEATNAQGQVVDSSSVGTNVGILDATFPPTWLASSNGIKAVYDFTTANAANRIYRNQTLNITNKNFSVVVWGRSTAKATSDAIMSDMDSSGAKGCFDFAYDNTTAGKMRSILVKGGGTLDIITTPFAWVCDGHWDMLTMTYDGIYHKFWVNNIFVGSNAVTSVHGATTNISIGTYPDAAAGADWNGWIAFPTIWTNVALTQTQIDNVWTNQRNELGWSNSLALSNPSLYPSTVLEVLGEYSYPADTSIIGTNHMTSYTGGNAYDPAWRANGTNGWWEFDGANDYLSTPTSIFGGIGSGIIITNMSVDMWVKHTSNAIASTMCLLFEGNNTYGWNAIEWGLLENYDDASYNHRSFFVRGSAGDIKALVNSSDTGTAPPTNTWTHIALTYDRDANPEWTFYTNGIRLALQVTNNGIDIYRGITTRFGYAQGANPFWYKGLLDAPRITGSTFSSNDVHSVYSNSKSRYGL